MQKDTDFLKALLENFEINIEGEADKKFKYTKHEKFAKKVLIWQVICSCGKKLAPHTLPKFFK